MSALQRLISPLRNAAVAFFRHDLSLRRQAGGVHIVLEQRRAPGAPRPLSRAELAARKEKQELELMLQQLAALLDDQPETRQTMRHLGFVEQALAKKGLRALHKLPLEMLERALAQLEGLVTNWSPEGLANLRSKIAVVIIDREHMDPDAEADAYQTAAVLDPEPYVPAPPKPRVAVDETSDDEALAAAYAALGNLAPMLVETQSELGSKSARALAMPAPRHSDSAGEISLRELQEV